MFDSGVNIEEKKNKAVRRRKIITGIAGCVVACIVCLVVSLNVIVHVPVGWVGLETKMSQVTGTVYQEGYSFKAPFITNVIKFDGHIKSMEQLSTEGELAGKELVYLTLDIKYRLDTSKVIDVYRTAGIHYETTLMPQSEILDIAKSTVQDYTVDDFGASRAAVGLEIRDKLNERFEERGIIFTSVAIPNYNFDPTLEAAISDMTAAVQRQKTQEAEIRAEKDRAAADKEIALIEAEKNKEVKRLNAEAEADATMIKAQAEANANALLSESITDQLIEMKRLEKWNGSNATVITSGSVITDTTGAQ